MDTHNIIQYVAAAVAVIAVIAAFLAYNAGVARAKALIDKQTTDAAEKLDQERRAVEQTKREVELSAKEDALKIRAELQAEMKGTRAELDKTKKRLEDREDVLDQKKNQLDDQAKKLKEREDGVVRREQEADKLAAQQRQELERVAKLTTEEARQELLGKVEAETRDDAAQIIVRIEQQAVEEGRRKAANIVGLAIQKCAVDQTTETTVSAVPLPSDEMKGRIIGREGRNIRAFEQLTGVDLIVDDTPEAVVVSAFDPIRREIAKIALTTLVSDGRIHPGRIEETVEKARQLTEERIKEAGERAAIEAGVSGLHPEIQRLLGKLMFRTSYGQNVLRHSIEVAHLAGAMAAEVGCRVNIARRAGLLHDLGKAVDFERDGPHAALGAEIAKTRGESADIISAIGAHHGDIQIETVEACLVQAADAISASRPGARRETLETYLKRLEGLEEIASRYEGVDKVFAIQAGREVRVIVKPDRIDDLAAHQLAKSMVERIEDELDYPGQIRVTVIRETRAVEYAK